MTSPRSPMALVRSLAVVVVVAAVFAALGRTGAAVAVLVAGTIATQAGALSAQFVQFIEQQMAPAVGRAVSLMLLAPIHLLVIVPAGLLARLVGLDSVARFSSGGRWQPGAAAVGRPTNTFVNERRFATGGGRAWRPAVALLVIGALLGAYGPDLLDRGNARVPTELQTDDGFNAMTSPAMDDAPWAPLASQEFFEAVAEGQTYTPYVGYSLRDYAGTHVNVEDRQRRSYEPEQLTATSPEIWFFGGSTMFGFSGQRDEHTIASETVRLAEDDGRNVRARNYGAPGYVNFQETVLLSQLLLAGGRPDVVVFYDGINDLALQLQRGFAFGEQGELGDLFTAAARSSLAGELTGTPEPPTPLNPAVDFADGTAAIDGLVRTYEQGIELAETLADRYDFTVVHSWQPDLFSKATLAPGEQEIIEPLGYDDFRFEALDRLSDEARAALPPGVLDLGQAYDDEPGPILNDQVHTNEAGARAVAAALYPAVRAALEDDGAS